jgi:hypothetical protein
MNKRSTADPGGAADGASLGAVRRRRGDREDNIEHSGRACMKLSPHNFSLLFSLKLLSSYNHTLDAGYLVSFLLPFLPFRPVSPTDIPRSLVVKQSFLSACYASIPVSTHNIPVNNNNHSFIHLLIQSLLTHSFI